MHKTEHERRRSFWLAKTGLVGTHGMWGSILPERSRYRGYARTYPDGFDHTELFRRRDGGHVLLTEPYSDRVDDAINELNEMCAYPENDVQYLVAPWACGLWRPGRCIPILIKRATCPLSLYDLALALPVT